MKTNEILTAFNVPKCKQTTAHCSKYAALYSLLISIKGIITGVELLEQNIPLFIGLWTRAKGNENGWDRNEHSGIETNGNKIRVTTGNGQYTFSIPTDNAFYYAVCDVIGLPYSVFQPTAKAAKTITVESGLIDAIKKAAKFVSKDALRPVMQGVCLHFENNTCEVVSTNAHYIYLSKLLACNCGEDTFELVIAGESLKTLAKAVRSENDTIQVIDENTAIINGINVTLHTDNKFPNYKVVVETYTLAMTFDRVQFIAGIKAVEPSQNRCTGQVNFHLNGNIQISACDIDMGTESKSDMPYVSKQFPDMDIAFNSPFLKTTLGIFKTDNLDMLHAGNPNKMAIFTDGSDRVGLCPLHI